MSDVLAAGALLWRLRKQQLEVALVHRPSYNDWSWPKGKPDAGESLHATAVREVEEETGIRAVLGQPLGSVRYQLSRGRTKEAFYWAAEVGNHGGWNRARSKVKRAPWREIDEVRWVEVHQALGMLTYDRDRVPLRKLIERFEEGRLDSWTVILARHAAARPRSIWKGKERRRGLTEDGTRWAQQLTPIFAAYGVERLVSSPWERCLATLEPYAALTGIKIRQRVQLAETDRDLGIQATRDVFERELLRQKQASVVCSHRPLLPAIFGSITNFALARVRPELPTADPWLEPGELLVLHVAKRSNVARIVEIERVLPS